MSVKAPGKGGSAKHTGTRKHHASRKHHPSHHRAAAGSHHPKAHHVARHPHHAKARGFAVGDLLPVCAFEALAMSLRLAGQLVDDDEIAWLWELTGAAPLGAALPAALDAARLHGLAGLQPRWKRIAAPVTADHLALPFAQDEAVAVDPFEDLFAGNAHALILGIDTPGPHCVLATADGWWSWGELHSPWPARIEEAWAVRWAG